MADNTTLNNGTGGDTLRTDDVGGGVKVPVSKIITGGDGVDGGFISAANPFPVVHSSGSQTGLLMGANPVAASNPLAITSISGSQIGILVGANPVAQSNPLPTRPMSGSQTGILVGANPAAISNPLPTAQTAEAAGTILSGSTFRTVNYAFGDFSAGSGANQVVPPLGAGLRIAVMSVAVMAASAVNLRFISTGSAGSITSISGLYALPANGGFVLPHNPHGWFKTLANEGLNLSLSSGVATGITITWAIFT